jgi:lysophospholipid acyltransferase (LPLAT)-like uncharacterized protein
MLKRFLRHPRTLGVLVALTAHYVRFCLATTRWRVEGAGELADFAAGAPRIIAFWHEVLPLMPILWIEGRKRGMRRGIAVLVSQHKDGQLIGDAMRVLGMDVISGSSSKGGSAALRQMVATLRSGDAVAITPDGPRGPRRVAAAGVAQLAALAGVPVMACAAVTSRTKVLGTWDRMRVPFPFGRGALVFAPLVSVARGETEAGAAAVEAALNHATDTAIGLTS